ncbi:MAG TPA: hypothetical protein G4O04_03900 [Anaerolineae bacterium]|nr:hypothetical protein [Anaerolineae bacterium]
MRNRRWFVLFALSLVAAWALAPLVSAWAALAYTEAARLGSPNPATDAAFGLAVALSGDWLAVGEPNANNGTGAVYLFHRVGLTWEHAATLTADDGATNDHFGKTLALSEGILAVGAPNADIDTTPNAGAVYLFTFANNAWQFSQKLTAPAPAENDAFGSAVALKAHTLAIGVPMADQRASNAGAVMIFSQGNDGTWSHQATLTAADGGSGDHLGSAVALYGDRVAAGAPEANANATDDGRVYIFLRQGNTWLQEAALTPDDAAANDGFGTSVALANGTLAVGAPRADSGGATDSGTVYIYTLASQQWSLTARLEPPDAIVGAAFGQAVAMDTDLAVIGAPQADAGTAYIFTADGPNWNPQARLAPANATTGDAVGTALALDAGWVALGAPQATSGGQSAAGIVALFTPEQARAVVQLLSAQGLVVRPRDILFPPTIQIGVDVTVQAIDQTWTAANLTGLDLDWHITLAATDFTDGQGHQIPAANFTVQMSAADITTLSGSSAPTSQVANATPLNPNGITLLSASNGRGQGIYDFTPHFFLTIPAGTAAGHYQTTVTVTMTAGP